MCCTDNLTIFQVMSQERVVLAMFSYVRPIDETLKTNWSPAQYEELQLQVCVCCFVFATELVIANSAFRLSTLSSLHYYWWTAKRSNQFEVSQSGDCRVWWAMTGTHRKMFKNILKYLLSKALYRSNHKGITYVLWWNAVNSYIDAYLFIELYTDLLKDAKLNFLWFK